MKKLEIMVTKGSLKNQNITIENGDLPLSNLPKYQVGDEVVINYSQDFEGNDSFYITDYVRRNALLWLFVIFVIMAVAIGRWQGATSLVGMGISFLVIATFLLSHGVNKKTGIAEEAGFLQAYKPGLINIKGLLLAGIIIASMVNTLVLVYTGAALPLLLLFVDNPHPFPEVVNYDKQNH